MKNDIQMPLQTPKPPTLKRYGLSLEEWQEIVDRQEGVCAICRKLPKTGRLCIDHEHIKGWKKLPPQQRKLAVRGLLCFFCNSRYCSRGITIEKAENMAQYLKNYRSRTSSQ
jgi:hypothetical protein